MVIRYGQANTIQETECFMDLDQSFVGKPLKSRGVSFLHFKKTPPAFLDFSICLGYCL